MTDVAALFPRVIDCANNTFLQKYNLIDLRFYLTSPNDTRSVKNVFENYMSVCN